jgi:hypothetical protein
MRFPRTNRIKGTDTLPSHPSTGRGILLKRGDKLERIFGPAQGGFSCFDLTSARCLLFYRAFLM